MVAATVLADIARALRQPLFLADGFCCTVVSGEVTFAHGESTGTRA